MPEFDPTLPAGPPSHPGPDWFPDPQNSNQLRYWDGSSWTDHFHAIDGSTGGGQALDAMGGAGPGDGRLVPVGQWFDATFKGLFQIAVPLLQVAAVCAVPVIALNVVLAVLALGIGIELDYRGLGSEPTGLTGFDAGTGAVAVAAMAGLLLVTAVWRLANGYLLYWSHRGQQRSAMQALRVAVKKLPRWVGWALVILAVFVVLAVLFMLVLFQDVGVAGTLLLLIVPVVFVVGVWQLPKIIFVETALAVLPKGTRLIPTLTAVARGRWWSIMARLLLLGLLAGVAGYGLQAVGSAAFAPQVISALDAADIGIEIVEHDEGAAVLVTKDGEPATSLALSDFLSTRFLLAASLGLAVLNALIAAAQWALFGSGVAHMYRDVNGPAEDDAQEPRDAQGVGAG